MGTVKLERETPGNDSVRSEEPDAALERALEEVRHDRLERQAARLQSATH